MADGACSDAVAPAAATAGGCLGDSDSLPACPSFAAGARVETTDVSSRVGCGIGARTTVALRGGFDGEEGFASGTLAALGPECPLIKLTKQVAAT